MTKTEKLKLKSYKNGTAENAPKQFVFSEKINPRDHLL